MNLHGTQAPSPWVERWAHLLDAEASVLDLACGWGRHSRYLAQRGHPVVAVDKDAQALASLHGVAETVQADIENAPWPLAGRQFGGVVVTHYLWRDVWPHILESLRPGGVLIYETFSAGNETVGKPSRPDFLLRTAELLTLCQGLRVVAFEDGFLASPESFIQRIVAVREPAQTGALRRYSL